MLRFGFLRLLAALVFGLLVPYALYRLARAIGLPLLIAGAVAVGLAYGAVKADNPWTGDGLAGNLRLMAVSALAIAAYVGVSVTVARAAARLGQSRP